VKSRSCLAVSRLAVSRLAVSCMAISCGFLSACEAPIPKPVMPNRDLTNPQTAPPQTAPGSSEAWVLPTDPRIRIMGRVAAEPRLLRFGYPGVKLFIEFEGTGLTLRAASNTGKSRLGLTLDGTLLGRVSVPSIEAEVPLVSGLSFGRHRLTLEHLTETWIGVVTVSGLKAQAGRVVQAAPLAARRLLFIGDSVTCGEGVDRTEDCRKGPDWWNSAGSYGVLTATELGAQVHLVCYGGRGLIRDWQGKSDVLNAPQFFQMAVAEDPAKVTWDHKAYVPDAVVVSLGTNDFSLGIGALPDEESFVSAYVRFVAAIRAECPEALIVLTEGAIVNDEADPARPQRTLLRRYLQNTMRLAKDTELVIFNDQVRPGDACDAHPTGAEHQALARSLAAFLSQRLGWDMARPR